MMRFVTGKYAKGLPVACMIGYVMDGDLSFAYARIRATIRRNGGALRLQDGPNEELPFDAMTAMSMKRSSTSEPSCVRSIGTN